MTTPNPLLCGCWVGWRGEFHDANNLPHQAIIHCPLHAAAADLLAACKAALEVFEEHDLDLPKTMPQVRAAIAAAEPPTVKGG